jgi:pimeloyl-ACP methyl ester carboxylesterase
MPLRKLTLLAKSWFSLSIIFVLVLSGCAGQSIIPLHPVKDNHSECVVLVHGLWRSGFAMRSIDSHLSEQGYKTVTIDYPSTSYEIPELAENYLAPGVSACTSQGANLVHIVTHSMGGIVARYYLQNHPLPEGSHVVMLSPPNQGSELSNKFGDSWWYQWIAGPAATSLTKDESGIIEKLKPVKETIGIIAAFRNWSLWPSSWLPTPNDGTVSVESMVLEEMDDIVLVEAGHAMMRFDQEVLDQVSYFLNYGKFYHSDLNRHAINTPKVISENSL